MKRRSSALSGSATLSVEERTAALRTKVQQLREERAALERSAAAVSSDAANDADDGPHDSNDAERPHSVPIGDTSPATSCSERNLPEKPPEGTARPAQPRHELATNRHSHHRPPCRSLRAARYCLRSGCTPPIRGKGAARAGRVLHLRLGRRLPGACDQPPPRQADGRGPRVGVGCRHDSRLPSLQVHRASCARRTATISGFPVSGSSICA